MKYIYQITILDTKSVQYFRKLKDLCLKYNINYANANYALCRAKKDWYEVDNFILQKHEVF